MRIEELLNNYFILLFRDTYILIDISRFNYSSRLGLGVCFFVYLDFLVQNKLNFYLNGLSPRLN